VRLVATKLDPTAPRRARCRARRQAPKAGRTLTTPTLAVAGGLRLIPTLDTGTWSPAAVLSLSRARWQGALVCKKMPQWLRLKQIRRTPLVRVEATVRALLVAWALPEDPTTQRRTLVRATPPQTLVVSSGLLSGLGLDTLRQQVQGRWSAARLPACLPRLRRFLCTRPRQRVHQESTVCAGREQRAHTDPDRRHKVA
jgi:hypothetical protein